jgi:hypothetical protein
MSPEIPPHRRGEAPAEPCGIAECPETSARSVARSAAHQAFPAVADEAGRVNLCRTHYKVYKKSTRVDRALARLGRY